VVSGADANPNFSLSPPMLEPAVGDEAHNPAWLAWHQVISDRLSAVGQNASATGGPVSLTNGIAGNVAVLDLPAGQWDVSGSVLFTPAAATIPTHLELGIGLVSGTIATPQFSLGLVFATSGGSQISGFQAGFTQTANGGPVSFSLTSSTTRVYLVARSSFTGGTMTSSGTISARRTR
jgi:hypothetical protein